MKHAKHHLTHINFVETLHYSSHFTLYNSLFNHRALLYDNKLTKNLEESEFFLTFEKVF